MMSAPIQVGSASKPAVEVTVQAATQPYVDTDVNIKGVWIGLGIAAFAVIYLYAFPYFDRLRNANEMPRILMTKAIVEHRLQRLATCAKPLRAPA